jgi:predicted amidohydrolase YtcJ
MTFGLDWLLCNAAVITMDPDRPRATRVGIWNGRVVGVDDEVLDLPATKVVDLGGATLLPASTTRTATPRRTASRPPSWS